MHIINGLLTLLKLYWLDLVIILGFILIAIALIKRGRQDIVKRLVYNLVVKAEATLGSGTGDAKYNMVLTSVYNKLPGVLRFFYTKKEIDNLIQEAVAWLKTYLSEGKTLLSYQEELKLQARREL